MFSISRLCSERISTALVALSIALSFTASGRCDDKRGTQADAFSAAANALAKSATDSIDLGRATERIQAMRGVLTERLLHASNGGTFTLRSDADAAKDPLNEVILLCRARANHLLAAAHRNYIAAVAAQIDSVGKPADISNFASAIGVLFASYSIDVKDVPNSAKLQENAKKIQDACADDLKDFETAYYGQKIQTADAIDRQMIAFTSVPFLGGVGPLIDTVSGVVTPVLIESAKVLQVIKRRDAVRSFLNQHEQELKNAGTRLAAMTKDFVRQKRLKHVGSFEENLVALRSNTIELSRYAACSDLEASRTQRNPITGGPSDRFILCWRQVWEGLRPTVTESLTSADVYDQLADAGGESNITILFDNFKEHLDRIKTSPGPGDDIDFESLWDTVTKMLAFAQKVQDASSQENRDKISKAIQALSK